MDTKDNKYKEIVNGIIEKKDLEKNISLFIDENIEKESKVDYSKLRRMRRRNIFVLSVSTVILITVMVMIIFNNTYPLTPKGVVRKYMYEIENGEVEKAGQYAAPNYKLTHDFFSTNDFSFKIVYNEVRDRKERNKSYVNVWIEYLNEDVEEYVFWLEKAEGKWRIISREEGNSKRNLSTGIQKYIPDEELVQDMHVDFGFSYSNKELVEMSDLIARIKVEDISYIMITSMDESIVSQKSMYGSLKILDIYYTNEKQIKKNDLLDIWIEYNAEYANIKPPGIEQEGEYIVFLKKLPDNCPMAWVFFDYVMLFDFNRYKLDYTEENELIVKNLIEEIY